MKSDFFKCGIIGMFTEVCFTGLKQIKNRDKRLIGRTSIWMFPIYGMASFIGPVSRLLKNENLWKRGLIYTFCIYVGEFTSGLILKKNKCCPWDYSRAKYNIKGLIRIDYAPLWFSMGIMYETILKRKKVKK